MYMQAFTTHTGIVAPLAIDNIDTDAIIPKQFLKSISRYGFGVHAFDEWRYLDKGELGQDCNLRPKNKDFILNQTPFNQATILLAGDNFGCGSSREHAPWALSEFGFKAIISSSFADIFFSNSYKNGLLPIVLPVNVVSILFESVQKHQTNQLADAYQLTIDLPNQCVITAEQQIFNFEITEFRKHCLMNALDEIALTLQHEKAIKDFEQDYYTKYSWLKQGINN